MSDVKGSALTGIRCSIKPGSGNWHFTQAQCDDCDVRVLFSLTPQQVNERYRVGRVRQGLMEAYYHYWTSSGTRFGRGYNAWKDSPSDPEVAALVELFRIISDERAMYE